MSKFAVRPDHDPEAVTVIAALRSALRKAEDYKTKSESQRQEHQGPGSLAPEFEALRKSLCVIIRAAGPFIV